MEKKPPKQRGSVDWKKSQQTLLRIQEINPAFTTENCLIGGSAAWFYRTLLERKNDPDFSPIQFTDEENAGWYSKDIDFIGTKKKDYPEELQTQPKGVNINLSTSLLLTWSTS